VSAVQQNGAAMRGKPADDGGSLMPVTYYVALPFIRTEEGIAAGQGQECPSESLRDQA
jgi:hypothetical protein